MIRLQWEAACLEAAAEMRAHAAAEWPRESVGAVDRYGRYRPLRNVHATPERAWDAGDQVCLADEDLAAIVHSHPSGAEWPSRADLESQIAAGTPYGVVPVTGGAARRPFFWPVSPPLLGRPYRHGVTDCYTLVRDWYARNRGLDLPAVAYDWRWDEDSAELDLYASWRRRLGWARVDPSAARPGDAVLLRMAGGGVANHAGVLLEDGALLHHPSPRPYDPTCLSRRTPLGRLARYVAEVVRPPEVVA